MAREPECPCNDCEERFVGCKKTCIRHFAWKILHDEWAEQCRLNRNGDHEAVHFRITGRDKNRKRSMRK